MKKYLLPSALILAFGLSLALAQNITKSVQLSQSAAGPIGVDTSNNVYFPNHILSAGRAPTINVAGHTVAGSDFAGTVTESSASVGATLTFRTAYAAPPHCVVSWRSGTAIATSPMTYSVVATSITWSHLSSASLVFDYFCTGAS